MKPDQQNRPVRVGLISLGCAKNLVDAEIMLGSLLREGVEITNDVVQADALIVNTCSFIDAAQEESVDAILESAAVRDAQNRGQALIVSGCLPQRFREELPKLLPEVDAFMGIDQVASVMQIVQQAIVRRVTRAETKPGLKIGKASRGESDQGGFPLSHFPTFPPAARKTDARKSQIANRESALKPQPAGPLLNVHPRPHYIPDFATPRFRLTPKHFAYVKIAEGCNHPCSFCIIPRMRGSHRSRKQSDLVQEARQLIAEGVKELNLISQDSTFYGLDLRPTRNGPIAAPEKFAGAIKNLPANATTLCTLLRELNSVPGEFWIRLLYTHPAHWTDELIRTIAECPKVARYIDMPLQHIHHNMLERMRRETSQQYILDLIARIRAGIPGVALRTTFIVGFPGETEEYFQTLLGFIRETQFERLGVFTYSREEGTRAGNMAGQIPDRIKKRRRNLAMAAQQRVARHVSESFLGRTIKVLVEKEATAKELKNAKVSSWEHGLIRGHDQYQGQLRGRFLVARGEADAPDIDGRVYVRGQLPLGEFTRVKIVGHTDYDLIAEPAKDL
jgi:ribosomal protein S12 methylthiotransferase